MRKVILGVAVSLDGYIEGPNGEYDWCFTDQEYGLKDFYRRIDTAFMGRKTFEMTKDHMGSLGSIRICVFSNSITAVPKGVQLIAGDVVPVVREIKRSRGKDIWLFGGAELTSFMVNEGLVDEFWLSVHPVILGRGKPLFQSVSERKWLELIEQKVYPSGLVSLHYNQTKNKLASVQIGATEF